MNNVVDRVVKEEEQKVLKKIKNYIYDHTSPIGKGFSSLVYSGHNEATNEVIAIKVIELAKIENAVQKYLLNNEINALRALTHPHVIRTIEILMTKHNVYIMTEFCEKGDLQQYIKRNGKLSEVEALHITRDIVEGYMAIEEKQIIHRDMKTANIFLTSTGARIADFGFCDFINETKKPPEFYNVGSPAYMSPQIYRENIYSAKSDIWGIGIILFEMLTGDTPDKNLTYFEMSNNLMNGKINSGPNEEIRKILAACFKKDLRERVSSIHLLDMVAKEIARLDGPAKLMVRPHTVGPHQHNQSMPASNSKIQGLSHVPHPLSPSEVNFRHSQRHMVNSALPLVDDSMRGQSPFKTRFGGIMSREDGREGRNIQPSPLKQGLQKRFTREDDSRAKREATISSKIKNLTEMLLFLFRQLNLLGDINLERSNLVRLILFRHRSHLEGLVEKLVSDQRLDRNLSEPLKGFHFLKSKFDQTYLHKEVQGNTSIGGPSHILARLNQYANQPFSESRCLSTYCHLILEATKQCEQSTGKYGLSSDQISKIGIVWDYMLIHVEIMMLYANGNTVDGISQDFIQLGNLLKEQPRKLSQSHIQLLKMKQKMITEQSEQWITEASREKTEDNLQGYRQLADLPQRKTLMQNGFF